MKRGLLLIDRGSREKEVKQELEVICKKIKEKGNYKFCNYCFLEVIPPFIEEGINQSISHDIDELINCSLLPLSRKKDQGSCKRINWISRKNRCKTTNNQTHEHA